MNRAVIAVAAVIVLVGGGAAAWYTVDRSGDDTVDAAQPVSIAVVQQQDVVTYSETTATLGFAQSVTVSSPAAGTVTTIISSGDQVVAGSVVATVDGAPVVAMIGDVPGFRDLSTSSSDGIDVRQLETNLVALGFDASGDVTIDESFDSATKAAVNAWKASLGLDEDGKVAQSLISFVPGDLQADTIDAPVGGGVSAGGALLTARVTERLVPIVAALDHTITALAASGTPVGTGTVLFRSNALPVAAIEGDSSATPALERDLEVGVDAGRDVRLLEQMLVSGGFDAAAALVVDDTFDVNTATAVLAWWQSVDPTIAADPATLTVPSGSFVVVPAGLQVGDATVADGALLSADATVLSLTAPSRLVTTSAPIGDETFALGAQIDVEFPDGTVTAGVVVTVGTVATNDSGTPGQTPSVDITIRVDEIPASVESFVSIPVTLRVVDEDVPGAFVVPTSALLALAEGGFALEVVTASATGSTPAATTLIPVEPGLYSNGFVVVTGDQVSEGLEIVVPS
jgi:peptidoglycan hydrolase-like protein with peptidoglycan-binding domain